MRIVILIIIALLTACNAVKRVNKDTEKQLKVIADYSSKNPSVNDTFTVYKPGDTVITTVDNFKTDTVFRFVSPSCPPERTITRIQKVLHTIRDTARITIVDRSREKAYQHVANIAEGKTTAMKERSDEYKKERNLWKFRFFGLLAISILLIFITLKFY